MHKILEVGLIILHIFIINYEGFLWSKMTLYVNWLTSIYLARIGPVLTHKALNWRIFTLLNFSMGEHYSHLFNLRPNVCKYWCLSTHFFVNNSSRAWRSRVDLRSFSAGCWKINYTQRYLLHRLQLAQRSVFAVTAESFKYQCNTPEYPLLNLCLGRL